jgi:hypothetical protein
MSKFSELCQVYSSARKNYFDYWHECANFVTDLMNGLREYFEMPKENLKFVPLSEKPEFAKKYAAKDSMLLEQDTFWYVGVMLTLCGMLEDQPEETLILPILVKKPDDVFIVKFGPAGDEFQIAGADKAGRIPFYDYIYNQINDTYTDRLHKFLEKMISERRIGFSAERELA